MLNIRACRKALWTGLQPRLMSKYVLYVVPRRVGRGCRAEASRWPGGQSGRPLYNQPMKVGELLNLRTFTACALILCVVVTTFFRIINQKNLFCLDHTPMSNQSGEDRATGSVQRILIRGVKSVISPDLRTSLRLGVGSGGLPKDESWGEMGDKEQRYKVERAWISVWLEWRV